MAAAGKPIVDTVHHRGRKTGLSYATPLGVRLAVDGEFVITLTFSDAAHWRQNIRAAGWCAPVPFDEAFEVGRRRPGDTVQPGAAAFLDAHSDRWDMTADCLVRVVGSPGRAVPVLISPGSCIGSPPLAS